MGSEQLIDKFKSLGTQGITITANGFYGPQSRSIRLKPHVDFIEKLKDLRYRELKFTNLEMETSGIYGLSALLNHNAVSLNAILANRALGLFSTQPEKVVENLSEQTLSRLIG